MPKKAKDPDILKQFPTASSYKQSLGKKVRDFSDEERKIYNRIAAAEKREKQNPFKPQYDLGETSTFLAEGERIPFADEERAVPPSVDRSALRQQLRSRRSGVAANQETPEDEEYIPTIADMEAVLRAAGKLDRTPPQLHLTPISEAIKDDEIRPAELLGAGYPRTERLIADQLAEAADLERAERIREKSLDQYINRKSALVDAMMVIGEKKRAERGAELMAELAAYENPPPLDEARRLVDEAIREFDRPARAESADRRERYRELMDSEVGDLKRALDEFNIPSDYLLKPTKKESRKQILKSTEPEWYRDGLPVPQSPRAKRLDLQFGDLDAPDDEFDPDPVEVLDEEDEWMREYLREDVVEARARQEIAEGRRIDPRPRRRALEDLKFGRSDLTREQIDEIYGTAEMMELRGRVVFDGESGNVAEVIPDTDIEAEARELENLLGLGVPQSIVEAVETPLEPQPEEPFPKEDEEPTTEPLEPAYLVNITDRELLRDRDRGVDTSKEDEVRPIERDFEAETAELERGNIELEREAERLERQLEGEEVRPAEPAAPPRIDLSERLRQAALRRGAERQRTTDIPTIEADNPYKVGTREHRRFEDKRLSDNLRFPPNVFTAERGREQFDFAPQPSVLYEEDVEPFSLDQDIPDWALDARSGRDTYNLGEPDIDDESYVPLAERDTITGRSLLRERGGAARKEDEEPTTEPLLPEDVREVRGILGEENAKEVVADEPAVEVLAPPTGLQSFPSSGMSAGEISGGGGGGGISLPPLRFAPKTGERRKKKKKKKKEEKKKEEPAPAPAPISAQQFFGQADDFFVGDESDRFTADAARYGGATTFEGAERR